MQTAKHGSSGLNGASSSDDREEMIDVVSHASVTMHSVSSVIDSRARSSTSSSSSRERGGSRLNRASSSGDDASGVDEDDDEEEEREYAQEHAYRRGRHTVPMHSPGEDLADIDLMADQHLSNGNMPRLPRLRNRVFFQSDGDASVDIAGVVGTAGVQTATGRRVLFRRRKRQEGDVFWTAIFLSNLLSLAVLGCLVVYLTQTDFFASHQNDLFGTTVDNRFTVVSQQDSRAKIYLKSGYSNSRYSEAMIAFGDGVLQLGRRALASTDAQKFYGLSLSHNGTAAFTNKVTAPTVLTDYLHAGKAVVFEDGTVMTTAANMSGGVKEIGDLNLVSKSGSVITSAGGKPVLIVDPLGTVAFPNADAEEPSAMGIVVDGAAGRVSIGGSFHVDHNVNMSTITTAHALHLNTTRVVIGSTSADKVTLTVPRFTKDPSTSDASEGDDNDDTDGNDATAAKPSSDLQKPTNLEIMGQSSSSQSPGGDVWVAGGDGLDKGGNVIIVGGVALDLDELRVGSVAVNAQLEPTGSSFTEIGTQGGSHVVYIQGNVLFNGNKTSTDNRTQVTVGGAVFNVEAKRISISNAGADASTLKLDSNDLRIGTTASSIKIGGSSRSALKLQAKTAKLDATEALAVGAKALRVSIGSASRSGQLIDVVSDSIRLSSSSSVRNLVNRSLESAAAPATVNKPLPDIEIANASVSVNALRLEVGASGKTASVALDAFTIAIGKQSLNSSVSIDGGNFSVSSANVEIGTEESTTTINGEAIVLDASELITLGEETDHIEIGSKSVENVNVHAKAINLNGAINFAGTQLLIDSAEIALGGKTTEQVTIGDQTTKKTVIRGQTVEIGSTSVTSVTIGSGSPEVTVGSPNGVINLQGKVILNGNAFESRRLSAVDSWFGYLNADHFVVETPAKRVEFALPFGDHYVSVESAVQFENNGGSAFQITTPADGGELSGHVKISLSLDGVRLKAEIDSDQGDGSSTASKLRCRVYRQQKADTPPSTSVLDAFAAVEHCSGTECDTEVFVGVSSERIIRFDAGDRFDVRCLFASSATGNLVVDGAQLWFTKL